MKKNAIVVGATGLIGLETVKLLAENDFYEKIYIITRRKFDLYSDPKIVEIIYDFNKPTDWKALNFTGNLTVFCCLGTTIKKAGSQENFRLVDQHYVIQIAKQAEAIEVDHFCVVSAMGANKNSSIFYNRVKGEMETELSALTIRQISIARPSLLLGERNERRTGEEIGTIVMKILGFLFVGPLKKYKAIEGKTVAKAMVNFDQIEENGVSIYESDDLQLWGRKLED